jgi:putative colanic acid biosynthesis acetyltransferase WcaF
LLRVFGATLGKDVHVYPSAIIWAPWNLTMGDHSSLADDVNCYSMAMITIGEKTVVSQGTYLCTGTHDYTTDTFRLYARPITIGDQAWICAQSFIMPGVIIGTGAVIGARSVVTKSMPEWTVSSGNPCVPRKPREFKLSNPTVEIA